MLDQEIDPLRRGGACGVRLSEAGLRDAAGGERQSDSQHSREMSDMNQKKQLSSVQVALDGTRDSTYETFLPSIVPGSVAARPRQGDFSLTTLIAQINNPNPKATAVAQSSNISQSRN